MPEKPSLFIEILKNVLKIDGEKPQEPSIQFRDETGDISDNRRMLEEGMPSPGPVGYEEMECPECAGTGAALNDEGRGSLCWRCSGAGRIPTPYTSTETGESDCPECGGTGSSGRGEGYDSMCWRCNGCGKISA